MMSLIKMSLTDVVKKQYLHKLKAYRGTYTTLIFLQLLGLLANRSSISSGGGLSFEVVIYNAQMSIALTMIWAFVTSIVITTKLNRDDDFLYVSNRISSHLANILFLVTAGVVAGVTATLAGFLLKDILYVVTDDLVIRNLLVEAPSEFMVGLFASVLYVLLMVGLGYLLGVLVQMNRMVLFLLPILYVGMSYFENSFIQGIVPFYVNETSIGLFALKVIVTVVVCFGVAVSISNRLEVRK